MKSRDISSFNRIPDNIGADLRKRQEYLQNLILKLFPEESKTQQVAKVAISQPEFPNSTMIDDSLTYFGDSKTLRTPAHQNMVIKFVRDQFHRARFQRIYDASTDGWKNTDFHRCCDKKGWTLTIVETTKGFIFGGFTTAEWESSYGIDKPDPHSFLFSVNEGSKYPITSGDETAIRCSSIWCAWFAADWGELVIHSYSNNITYNRCCANRESFKLPAAKGSKYPSINGGEECF